MNLGFTANFFGVDRTAVFVNNNGNVTFNGGTSTFTPFEITTRNVPIIAPFFADVDTRGAGSGLTQYGTGMVDGRNAFGVSWRQVGYYSGRVDKLNTFQLILIDRSDVEPGAFDIEFNYDQIQWEAGNASNGVNGLGGSPARAGWASGTGQTIELNGAGVIGGYLDTNLTTGLVYNSLNSDVPGRYIFQVRSGGVINAPPVANAGTDLQVAPSALGALYGGGSFDPEGAPIFYSWMQTAGDPVVLNGTDTATPTFVAPGTAQTLTFQLTVSDDELTAIDTVEVQVVPGIPIPIIGQESVTDLTSNSATLNAPVNANGADTTVHFEYGGSLGYSVTTTPQNIGSGMTDVLVSVNITGLLPNARYHFRTVASNANGTAVGQDIVFFTGNVAPRATNDTVETDEDTPLDISPLANDTDPDGDAISLLSVGTPAHGMVVQNGDMVTYTPTAGYSGPDQFTYIVQDAEGAQDTGFVFITVNEIMLPSFTDVIVHGDMLPGLAAGAEVAKPSPGVIDQDGHVLLPVLGQRNTGDFTTANDMVLVTDSSGSLNVIAREGTPVPSGGGTLFGIFGDLILTQGGQSVTVERFKGATTTTDYGYLASPDGSMLELISREGDAAPDGGTFTISTDKPAADAMDRIYFRGSLSGVSTKKNSGVWYDAAGVLTRLAQEGQDAASITSDPAWFGNFQSYLTAGGDGVAFVASLQGNPDDVNQRTDTATNEAVFVGAPGALSVLARKGDTVPDVVGGVISNISAVARGGDAGHAFITLMNRVAGSITSANDQVLIADLAGTKHLVAQEGTTPVGTTGLTIARFGEFFMSTTGEVTFTAYLKGAPRATDGILCRWSVAGGLVVLVREGDTADGTGATITNFEQFSVSPGGAVALQTALSGAKRAILRALPGATTLSLVVQKGDAVTVGAEMRTVLSMQIYANTTGTSGGGGGMGAAINDAGEVLVVLSLSAGDSTARIYRP